MSPEVFARVRALYRKATELNEKGHILRSAENYGRAAEAARALDPGPDNFVALSMRLSQAASLINHDQIAAANSSKSNTTNSLDLAAGRANTVALLSTVVAALERRRVADTLLEGKCTAVEEAWYAVEFSKFQVSPAEAACLVKLGGYDNFVRAADIVVSLITNAFLFAEECSGAQFQAFTQHIIHAMDLLQLNRCPLTTLGEGHFAETLSSTMACDLGERGLDARLSRLLADAWRRFQQSGVLEARGFLDEGLLSERRTSDDTRTAAIGAAMAAPGLRSCALAGCGAREAHPEHFKSCAACRTVVYCCCEHQVEAWPSHKAACKAACKAASSDGCAGPGAARMQA